MLKPPRASVPCNGCTLCCKGDLIVLHPEDGDDPSQYETYVERSPLTGKPVLALMRNAKNECVYLGHDGCTIHERAPLICREFDCRRMYKALDRKTRRRAISTGWMTKDILDAGRKRLHTLENEDAPPASHRQLPAA
ncbi:MAG TPA: YkgJ family cysteine cluster protein [Steroidobacteraceae bacterium]|nr:YkgJ family cysteine cluster protein [Steroidobacteraceae bacterium]